jgi:hypothetical protein
MTSTHSTRITQTLAERDAKAQTPAHEHVATSEQLPGRCIRR